LTKPASKGDKDFLENFVGGRSLENNPTNKPNEGAESFTDDYLKLRKQKKAEEMIKDEFGNVKNTEPEEPKAKNDKLGDESLQATIVRGAMDMQTKTAERVEKMLSSKEEDLKEARENERKSEAAFYQVQIDQLKDVKDSVAKALEEIRKGAQPKSAIEVLEEAETLIDRIEKRRPKVEGIPATTGGVSESTLLKLEEMKENHEIAMKNLELQISKSNNEFQLKMAEFKDNRMFKIQEYQDNVDFRKQGMSGVEDLIGSIGAGIDRDRGRGESAPTKKAPRGKSSEPHLEATIRKFPCQTEGCDGMVLVKETDSVAVCPECDAEYEIKKKG